MWDWASCGNLPILAGFEHTHGRNPGIIALMSYQPSYEGRPNCSQTFHLSVNGYLTKLRRYMENITMNIRQNSVNQMARIHVYD